MDQKEKDNLIYRRQYLLSPQKIKAPFHHKEIEILSGYYLYVHPEVNVTSFKKDNVSVFLIGELFDHENSDAGNSEILKAIFDTDISGLLIKIEKYTGRYAIVYATSDQFKLFTDVIASRKIYYSVQNGKTWFASQPHLLASVLKLKKTEKKSLLNYYNSPSYEKLAHANIGDYTCYDEIRQLIPNHYYDAINNTTVRFWPNRKLEKIPIEKAARECALIIRGYCDNVVHRYDHIMLPITAGKDSRILFSATKDSDKDIYYYVNKSESTNKHDITVPVSLLRKFGRKMNIEEISDYVDPDFKEIYFRNNPQADIKVLPLIYNYYRKFNQYINLPGNISSGGHEYYKFSDSFITARELAVLNGVEDFDFAVEYYDKWLHETRQYSTRFGIDLISLFYWEERLANWGMQVQLDKDIAQEDFNLLNSRDYISRILSVEIKAVTGPGYRIHKRIIEILCNECASTPYKKSPYQGIRKFLQLTGLLPFLYKIKFKIKSSLSN
jgi:hypothetical protein